jgi:predicted ATPase
MPWLISRQQLEELQARVMGATRERMLREMAETLDALASRRPLLLVLEDLHWSDYSTIDLLQMIARRRDPARLMIIGTYRPADAKTAGNPLHSAMQELRTRGYCHELPLTFLSENAVADYLGERFPTTSLPQGLPRVLQQRTEGNPLFMVAVADHWVAQGLLAESQSAGAPLSVTDELGSTVPESLRQMIDQQFSRLPEQKQQTLEAAAVAGLEFSTATVAAATEMTEDDVEAKCTRLAREGQFIRLLGVAEWPDGTFASRFGFIHSLYEEVLYERIPAGRRVRLHQRIGECLEAGHGAEAREMAAELANHFVRGRDPVRAVRYSRLAAEHAFRRSAHREAIQHVNTGLQLLAAQPDSPQRAQLEFSLQSIRGPALIAIKGWATPEVEQAFQRAVELSEDVPEHCDKVLARLNLASTYEIRGQYPRAQAALEQGLHSAAKEGRLLLESHELMACTMFHQGQFAKAVDHAKSGFGLYDPQRQYSLLASFGDDPGVACKDWEALSLWYLGFPDQALHAAEDAIRLAEDHVYSLANARAQRAYLHQFRRESAPTAEWAGAAAALAREQGFPFREGTGSVLLGWAMAQQGEHSEGIALLRHGLETCRSIGVELDGPYFLALLAEAYSAAERHEEGLYLIAEALATVRNSRAFFYEAELHRLMGSLLLRAGTWHVHQVEGSFQAALEIARRQNAKSIELRAATSLASLWRQQDRRAEARQLLQPIHDSFTEGFDTPDLRQARALLEENDG